VSGKIAAYQGSAKCPVIPAKAGTTGQIELEMLTGQSAGQNTCTIVSQMESHLVRSKRNRD